MLAILLITLTFLCRMPPILLLKLFSKDMEDPYSDYPN